MLYDGIHEEEIQNQVERSLMAERYYEVAKAFILYRQKHYEDREVKEKLDFLINYCNAQNAATGTSIFSAISSIFSPASCWLEAALLRLFLFSASLLS